MALSAGGVCAPSAHTTIHISHSLIDVDYHDVPPIRRGTVATCWPVDAEGGPQEIGQHLRWQRPGRVFPRGMSTCFAPRRGSRLSFGERWIMPSWFELWSWGLGSSPPLLRAWNILPPKGEYPP